MSSDKFDRIKHQQALYRDGDIRRESYDSEMKAEASEYLRVIGKGLNPNEKLTYMGSAAVHVYMAEALGQMYYVTQDCMSKAVQEVYASGAIEELMRSVAKNFGRDLPTKRSGF